MADTLALAEICLRITKGTTPTISDGGFAESGVNYIKSECLSYDGRVDTDKFVFISPHTHERLSRSKIQDRDILYSIAGANLGKCGMARPEMLPANTNQAVAIIRVDPEKGSPEFVSYVLRSSAFVRGVLGGVAQSAQPNVNLADIGRFRIPSWPISTQIRIAEVLSALDNKNELNRRTNETLEGMAQAIFRDWFVDFGPVHRKATGEADPVAIMGGLTPDPARAAHLAALFPAAFGNDGLPVGWSDGTLARLALVNSESWKASNHPAEVEYVDLSNTKWGTIEATARLTWEAAPSRARRIAKKGDSIIGTVRPGNGSYAYIGRDGYTVSTGFAVLRPKQAIYTDAIYVAATAADNITRLANLADGHGGAYPAVNPDVVAATPFPVVPDALLTAFSTFASPLREKIEQAKLENTTLAETRDYLLPRLMSGAVRVAPQAEAA